MCNSKGTLPPSLVLHQCSSSPGLSQGNPLIDAYISCAFVEDGGRSFATESCIVDERAHALLVLINHGLFFWTAPPPRAGVGSPHFRSAADHREPRSKANCGPPICRCK